MCVVVTKNGSVSVQAKLGSYSVQQTDQGKKVDNKLKVG